MRGTVEGEGGRVESRGNQFTANQGQEWTSICTTRSKREISKSVKGTIQRVDEGKGCKREEKGGKQ